MRTKKCPMCQGEQFYAARLTSFGDVNVSLGIFSKVPVQCLICLACGFVAPCVSHGYLAWIRSKVKWPWGDTHEGLRKDELLEL
jgi:hypothetical protein